MIDTAKEFANVLCTNIDEQLGSYAIQTLTSNHVVSTLFSMNKDSSWKLICDRLWCFRDGQFKPNIISRSGSSKDIEEGGGAGFSDLEYERLRVNVYSMGRAYRAAKKRKKAQEWYMFAFYFLQINYFTLTLCVIRENGPGQEKFSWKDVAQPERRQLPKVDSGVGAAAGTWAQV